MSAKHLIAGVLLTVLVGAGAQPIVAPGGPPPTVPGGPPPATVFTTPVVQPVSPTSSRWLQSNEYCECCGPVGRHGPIGSEWFLSTGPTIPTGGSVLANNLNTGWMVEAGGRSMFFNTSGDKAWSLRFGLGYQYNNGKGAVPPINFFGLPVTVRDLHRWSVSLTGGRDWFLLGQAQNCPTPSKNLRVGVDTGARYGTERLFMNLVINDPQATNNFLHRHDVYGAWLLGTHVKAEIPMGSWVWFGGLRAEWAYNFSDILQIHNSSIHDFNFLVTTGFRY